MTKEERYVELLSTVLNMLQVLEIQMRIDGMGRHVIEGVEDAENAIITVRHRLEFPYRLEFPS